MEKGQEAKDRSIVSYTLSQRIYIVFKYIFDIFFSALMMIPLFVLCIIVKAVNLFKKDDGSLFYRQKRIGKDGKPFKIIKFRTMSPNAERELQELLKDDNNKNEWEEYHKLKNDPRITPFGLFLRKSSLDEFPQFINVLKGDMALIGPRPLLKQYLPLYNQEQMRRHNVRPGISGWAQVNGRNNLSWTEKFKLDVWYVDHLSFALDLKIIFLTLKKVFKRESINNKETSSRNITEANFDGTN